MERCDVEATDGGWGVLLDERPVLTPARRKVVVPVRAMADEVAVEWRQQDTEINPLVMPMTRTAATCLDRVAPEKAAMTEMIAEYGGTDLLCYRAEFPAELVRRQTAGWDPLLDWAATALEASLNTGIGVMHVEQPSESLSALSRATESLGVWQLASVAELTTLSGSLVIAHAVHQRRLPAEEAWDISRIDELWNIEQWGEDHDAAEQTAKRMAAFLHAARVLSLLDADD